jgi:methyltransferase (TIGR00027 family)
MREDEPSETAAWVAAFRGLAPWLPEGGQLASDPFGLEFAPRGGGLLVALPARAPWVARLLLSRGMLARMMLWLQVRTRALDDHLRAFARAGGRQLVLLGAGFDCRASRFTGELRGGRVFEIDHPATQRRKREVLARLGAPSLPTEFVAWNFEQHPASELPAHLASIGLDAAQPTFTIWEGVTPYLTEPAIAATVHAVREWSRAPGSQLGFTYIEPQSIKRSWRRLVSALGEPWRFGWEPAQVAPWMAAHGMRLVADESDADLARRYLPERLWARLGEPGRHVALAEPT